MYKLIIKENIQCHHSKDRNFSNAFFSFNSITSSHRLHFVVKLVNFYCTVIEKCFAKRVLYRWTWRVSFFNVFLGTFVKIHWYTSMVRALPTCSFYLHNKSHSLLFLSPSYTRHNRFQPIFFFLDFCIQRFLFGSLANSTSLFRLVPMRQTEGPWNCSHTPFHIGSKKVCISII